MESANRGEVRQAGESGRLHQVWQRGRSQSGMLKPNYKSNLREGQEMTTEQRREAALKAWVTIRAKRAGKSTKPKASRSARKNRPSLLDHIRSNGGLDMRGFPGERRTWLESDRGRQPGLFRNSRCVLSWEEMLTECNNEGFGPFADQREFFDAIDNEVRGLRQYSSEVEDQDEADRQKYIRNLHHAGICALCHQALPTDSDGFAISLEGEFAL